MKMLIKIFIVLFTINSNLLSHNIEALEVDELESYIKQAVIIVDIRDDSKRTKHGLVPSSYLLEYKYFNNHKKHKKWKYSLVKLIKEKRPAFVLVSQDGKKAKKLAKKLYDENKLKRIMYLKGGFKAWKNSNKKVINY